MKLKTTIMLLLLIAGTSFAQRPRWSNLRYKAEGLVGFYHYEEGEAKDMLTDSTGTLYDDAYVGTVSGSDTASGAIFFDGASDYATYTPASGNEHISMGQELTYFTRMKKANTTSQMFAMRWGKSGTSNRYVANRYDYSGRWLGYLYAFPLDWGPVIVGQDTEKTFVVTHSESDSNQYYYDNGAWISTKLTGTSTIRYATNAGDEDQYQGTYSGTDRFGNGWISEFRIYNRALSQKEVMKLTQEGDSK